MPIARALGSAAKVARPDENRRTNLTWAFDGDLSFTPTQRYYVDLSAGTNGDGSIASPFNTLASLPVLVAGNVVEVSRGSAQTMSAAYTVSGSGTLAAPIVIRANPRTTGPKPVLTLASEGANGIVCTGRSNVIIENLVIAGSAAWTSQNSIGVFLNGALTNITLRGVECPYSRFNLVGGFNSTNVRLEQCSATDNTTDGLRFWSGTGTYVWSSVSIVGGTYSRNGTAAGANGAGISVYMQPGHTGTNFDNITISGVVAEDNYRGGIALSDGVVDWPTQVLAATTAPPAMRMRGLLIENNQSRRNGFSGISVLGAQPSSLMGVTIRGNVIEDNGSRTTTGNLWTGGCLTPLIESNICRRAVTNGTTTGDGQGIFDDQWNDGAIVRWNLIEDNVFAAGTNPEYSSFAIGIFRSANGKHYGNVIRGCRHGFYIGYVNGATAPVMSGIEVDGNTIVNTTRKGVVLSTYTPANAVAVRNNLIVSAEQDVEAMTAAAGTQSFATNYALGVTTKYTGNNVGTTAFNHTANSSQVNAAGRPLTGSVLLGAGTTISGRTDYLGAARGTPPAVGAYESPDPALAPIAPAFSAAPVILGTPTVGVPVAYTSGTVTGTPTPSSAQQWTLDGADISGATASTYTPLAGDVGTARLRVRQIATNAAGTASSTSSAADVAAAASGSASLASFTLTRASAGTGVPFHLGHVFKKGDVPAGVVLTLNSSSYQVLPISTWDDGSLRHAIVAGTANLAANVPLTVTFGRGSAPGGAALTEASLITAAPTASVSFGTAGTVSLAALLGTSALKVTEHAGPVYAAFQYVADFPSDATMRAVFYVQLWAGGSYRVRTAVEWGRPLDAYGGAGKTGTCTITIAGTQVLNQSVTMLPGNRFDAEGANFTLPTALHDVAYIRSTKLAPNYGWTAPSAAALNALTSTYTPVDRGGWIQDMGTTGFAPHIGLLPHWDAMYLTSGDVRALNASLINGRAYGCYGVFWRDATTHRMPKPSDYPTAYANSEDIDQRGNGGNRWEFAHHPNTLLPWLLTGERFHLETLQANAWTAYYTCPPSGGVSRIYNSQTRGRAWRFRTACAAAAFSPTGDLAGADYRTGAAANLAQLRTDRVDTGLPGTGLVWTFDDKDGAVAGFQHSIFESLFGVAALGWAWDIEPGFNATAKTNHQLVRDFSYKGPVGLTGRGQAQSEFNWRRAPGPYRMVIGADGTLAGLYNTWGEVNLATYGSDNLTAADGSTILESYADDPSADAFPQGNWGHVITALSYAVDHGATGAQAGMNRVLGASNWAANATKFNNWPAYGVLPRLPSWVASRALLEWVQVPATNTIASIVASTASPGAEGPSSIVNSWSGATVRQKSAEYFMHGAGHTASADNSIVGINLASEAPTWRRAFGPTPNAQITTSTDYYADGNPAAQHTYWFLQWDKFNDRMMRMVGGAYPVSGLHTPISSWPYNAANWNAAATHPNMPTGGQGFDSGGCCSNDATGEIYFWGTVVTNRFDPVTNTFTFHSTAKAPFYNTYNSLMHDPVNNCVWSIGGTGNTVSGRIQKWDLATNNFSNVTVTGTSAGKATGTTMGVARDPTRNQFHLYDGDGLIHIFDPATLTITLQSMTGTAPQADSVYGNLDFGAHGHFGKFQYVAALGMMVTKPAYSGPMFGYRVHNL